MLRFLSLAFLSLTAALLLLTGPAESGDKKKKPVPPTGTFQDATGEPKEFRSGQPAQYAVWHQNGRWHLRTTTAQSEHQFKGSIAVEGGRFDRAHSHDLEKEGKLADVWLMNPDRNEITFNFKSKQNVDGLDFIVTSGAKTVRFNLLIDGKHVPQRVFIGQGNHHPTSDSFRLLAHGKAK